MLRSPLMERSVNNNNNKNSDSDVVHDADSSRQNIQHLDNDGEQHCLQFNSSQSMDTPIKQLNRLSSKRQSSNRNIDKQNMQMDVIPSILRAAADKRDQLVINVPIQNVGNNKQNVSPYRRKRVEDDNEKGVSKIEVGDQQKIGRKDYQSGGDSEGDNIHHNDNISDHISGNDLLIFGHGLQPIAQQQQYDHSAAHLSKYQNTSTKSQQIHKQSSPLNTQLLQPPSLSLKDSNNKLQHQKNKHKLTNKLSYSISQSFPSNRFETYLSTTRTPSMIMKFLSPSSLTKPKLLFSHNQSPCQQSDIYSRYQLKASRESIVTKKQLKLTLANNLDKILFKYNGGHARVLYNNKLKIKNDSPVSVEVKILCTSPSHYDVKPLADMVMCPSQIMNFVIEMKLYLHDLDHVTMKHDLERYREDMFKICYWSSQYSPVIEYEEGERVLPVVIEDTEEEKIRNQGLLEDQKDQQKKMVESERSIQMYKKMIGRNEESMSKMQLQIQKFIKKKFYVEYFTKNVFWVVAVFGVLLGWWLG